jgi:GNAT superfamily N-acetyltransferase
LRLAIQANAEAIADVYFASYRLLDFLPKLDDLDSYRWYVANVMLKEWTVTVAEDDSGIVAFLGRRGEEMGHFYTRPDRIGQGVGTQLVEAAKASGVDALELWCFSDQYARPALLRGARLSRDPLHRRRRQRGADTRCALPLGADHPEIVIPRPSRLDAKRAELSPV